MAVGGWRRGSGFVQSSPHLCRWSGSFHLIVISRAAPFMSRDRVNQLRWKEYRRSDFSQDPPHRLHKVFGTIHSSRIKSRDVFPVSVNYYFYVKKISTLLSSGEVFSNPWRWPIIPFLDVLFHELHLESYLDIFFWKLAKKNHKTTSGSGVFVRSVRLNDYI